MTPVYETDSRLMRLSLLLVLPLLAFGCASTRSSVNEGRLVGTAWELIAIKDSSESTLVAEADLVLTGDGSIGGSAGCNRFFGTAEIGPGDALTLRPQGTTRMACPPSVMEQEQRMLRALRSVSRAVMQDKELHLIDAEGVVLLRMRAVT